MSHTLQSRVRVLLLTLLLASSPALPATSAILPAGFLDLPSASSILSSLWDLLTGEKSTTAPPNGQPQPAAVPSGSGPGSGTGGSGTSSGDGGGDRGSGMDPDG